MNRNEQKERTTVQSLIRRIKQHPSYERADRDIDFLARDELRSTRLQLEFLKPELTLLEQGVESTVVVLGGARIREPCIAEREVERARTALGNDPENPGLKQQFQIAERILAKSHYYEIARELGQIVGGSGQGPDDSRLVICTGGGPGIMEAANRGAWDAGAKSIGLNIVLPHEQEPNPYITPDLCFQFRYFALRKMHFLMRARALVVFPGGYGTLDEFFDMITLIQTKKVERLPVIVVGEEYWRHVFDIQYLVDEGTISPEDIGLYGYAETAQEIWNSLNAWYEGKDRPLLHRPDA